MSLFDQPEAIIEKYWERATDELVDSAWLPLSDDVWATDKYDDQIAERAETLWEKDQAVTHHTK
jgi:hypothetical protein